MKLKTMKLLHYLIFMAAITLISSCKNNEDEDPQIAKSDAKQILEFSIKASENTELTLDAVGVINETDKTLALSMANGTVITSLIPSIKISDLATINPLGNEEQDFTNPFTYTVSAEDGSKQDYTVTVTVAKKSDKEIIGFKFLAANNEGLAIDSEGTINEVDKTISIEVPFGTPVNALIPSIVISGGATINPENEVANDFTEDVIYTVTAEDGSTQDYTITLSVGKRTENDMVSFSFLLINNDALIQDYNGTIDGITSTIEFLLPYGTVLSELVPTLVISDGATVSPSNELVQDFSTEKIYTVTAENGDEKQYTVIVTTEDPLAITGFAPTSAKIGDQIVISGTSFSEVAEENQVYFNGIQAIVTASTKTSITVTVPLGATNGKITVFTVYSETSASSAEDFIVISVWEQIANFVGEAREKAFSFSINGKGYVGGGYVSNDVIDMWEYNATTNSWTQKADFAGGARTGEATFSIGNKGYIATGYRNWNNTTDLWEYNSETNTWTSKTNFPGAARNGGVGFAIGNKGYLGLGSGIDGYYNDFYEYDPSTDLWTQIADFNGAGRASAVSFSIGQKGYVSTGIDENNVQFKDLWEYDQSTNQWAQKSDFGGTERQRSIGFSLNGKGYITTGIKQQSGAGPKYFSDFWEYNPATDEWVQKEDFKGGAQFSSVGFVIANKAYIGTGVFDDGSRDRNEFWVFDSLK